MRRHNLKALYQLSIVTTIFSMIALQNGELTIFLSIDLYIFLLLPVSYNVLYCGSFVAGCTDKSELCSE